MHMLKQCLVHKGLVVSSTCVVHEIPKIFQYGVVQADRDLCLSGSGLTTAPRLAREKSMSRYFSATSFFIEYDASLYQIVDGASNIQKMIIAKMRWADS